MYKVIANGTEKMCSAKETEAMIKDFNQRHHIFSLDEMWRAQGETDKAVEMFTQIVTQYADSEQADKARQQLAELAPDNQQAAVPGQSIISQGETAADETAAGSGAETQAAQ